MARHTNMSILEYVLIAFVVFVAVLVGLSPILGLITDGIKLVGALLAGDAAAIGSLVK